MSNLHKKYLQLKQQNCEYSYLFKCGIFYIFLDEDAKRLSPILSLKLTNLNDSVVKCGFPTTQLDKYLAYLKSADVPIKVIESYKSTATFSENDYIYLKKSTNFIKRISKINADKLSISEAFDLLQTISLEGKELLGGIRSGKQ